MQRRHRNSQKRIYGEEYVYFITTNVADRRPFFKQKLFCDLFIENLRLCKELKDFKLYGFVIIPCHVHMMIEPGKDYDISKIMKSLKENFSRNVNQIIKPPHEGETTSSRLREGDNDIWKLPNEMLSKINFNVAMEYEFQVEEITRSFNEKFAQSNPYRKFQWQSSFRDHVIRDPDDFNRHLRYIWENAVKHKLVDRPEEWKYSSYKNFRDIIDIKEL